MSKKKKKSRWSKPKNVILLISTLAPIIGVVVQVVGNCIIAATNRSS